MDNPSDVATVQVWAKGFRVSEQSAEFQMVVPAKTEHLSQVETAIHNVSWGKVLQPLYGLQPHELEDEFSLMFSEGSATMLAAAHSTDRQGRPSIVVVGCTFEIDWSRANLAESLSRAHGLAVRLAVLYGKSLHGGGMAKERQLRDGRFLLERGFELNYEACDSTVSWPTLVAELKRWKGISGVATRNLMNVDANVMYGTRDEAERNLSNELAGYFDLTRGKVVVFGNRLVLWPSQSDEDAEGSAKGGSSAAATLDDIRERLDRIEKQQERTVALLGDVLGLLNRRRLQKKNRWIK